MGKMKPIDNGKEYIEKIFAHMKAIEQWCLRHMLSSNDFFIKDGTAYCRKCNFPMHGMQEIMFYRCLCCDGTISRQQVMEMEDICPAEKEQKREKERNTLYHHNTLIDMVVLTCNMFLIGVGYIHTQKTKTLHHVKKHKKKAKERNDPLPV